MMPPTDHDLDRAWDAAGRPCPPPIPPALPGEEWTPDPTLTPRGWQVRGWTLDGIRTPVHGHATTFTPAEALSRIVRQARAEGWPVASMRWTVTPAPEVTPP